MRLVGYFAPSFTGHLQALETFDLLMQIDQRVPEIGLHTKDLASVDSVQNADYVITPRIQV